jgi:hypothetical protein
MLPALHCQQGKQPALTLLTATSMNSYSMHAQPRTKTAQLANTRTHGHKTSAPTDPCLTSN